MQYQLLAVLVCLAPTLDARLVGSLKTEPLTTGEKVGLIAKNSKRPLSSSDQQAVGEALMGAMNALKNHAGGGKYASCAKLFPKGVPDGDENSATWKSCKDLVAGGASLVVKGSSVTYKGKQPLTSREKEAVGNALAGAMGALKDHKSGSKYDTCSRLFPNGVNDEAPNSPTWLTCKDLFGHQASLMARGASVTKKQPLTSSEKEAVGNALAGAMDALKNHAGGGKYASCSKLFPNGTPDGEESSATWQSCKDIVGRASLIALRMQAINRHSRQPLTSSEKETVGNALADAMGAMKDHAGGDKYDSCVKLYPGGVNDDSPDSPTWVACKDILAPQFGDGIRQASLVAKGVVVVAKDPKPTYNESEYQKEWHKEHRNDPYPDEAKDKMHHPEYVYKGKKDEDHIETVPAEEHAEEAHKEEHKEEHSEEPHHDHHEQHKEEHKEEHSEHAKSKAPRSAPLWLAVIVAVASSI